MGILQFTYNAILFLIAILVLGGIGGSLMDRKRKHK